MAGHADGKGVGFDLQTGGQVHLQPVVDGLLGGSEGNPALGGDSAGGFVNRFHQPAGRQDPVDHADPLGFCRRYHLAGKNHLLGPVAADQQRQPLGAAETGNEAQRDLRQAEHGIFRGVNEIAGQGHFTAAPQGKPVDRGDHRNGQFLQTADDQLSLARKQSALQGVERGQFVDVRPGHKGFITGAGQDQDAGVPIGFDPVQGERQLVQQLRTQGVEHLGAVEGDGGDTVILFNDDILVVHQSVLL